MEQDSTAFIPLGSIDPQIATFDEDSDPLQEEVLGIEISRMWDQHCSMQDSVKETRTELALLGQSLGASLSRMKGLLAKPGRAGGWSAFLKERGIPRTTADRLVSKYERSLCPEPNCADGAIPDSPDATVRKLFAFVWPRLRRVLNTRDALAIFMAELTDAAEACFQEREAVAQGDMQPVFGSDQQPSEYSA